jgi:hypothetical protein
MSCVRLNLIDFNETVSGEVHGGVGDAVVAALSAEPETVGEIDLALARFQKRTNDSSLMKWLSAGPNFEPYDAGIVIVDLAARIVTIDSPYSAPPEPMNDSPCEDHERMDAAADTKIFGRHDTGATAAAEPHKPRQRKTPPTYGIRYHDGEQLTDIYLPYRLPEDWLFLRGVPEYKGARVDRQNARRGIVWRDYREVLFGKPLCTFLAQELIRAPNPQETGLFTDIHARWLMTKRSDLQGRTPRELLLEKLEFIDFDLHSRQLQWSFTGECPPSLLPTSHAYRFGGFGTHEVVIYYDLIRLLLSAYRERLREGKQFSIEDEADRLVQIKDAWLETVNDEYQHKAPALVIEWERKRIPLAMSGKDAVIDDDCPVCQAMTEDLGPYFWHLDGSAMDDQFEFSFHQTIEEWEAERREWEEFSRQYNRRNVFDKAATVRITPREF